MVKNRNDNKIFWTSIFGRNSTLPQNNTPLPLLYVQYPDVSNLIIKTKKIGEILNGLNIIKSAGPGELPTIVLKHNFPELTPVIAKLFHRIPQTYNILNNKQYGFRKSRSTTDLLTFLTNSIHHNLEGHGETHLTALDITKAFGRVWHEELLSKISHYGLSPLSQVIKSFLTDRKIRVILDGSYSSWHHIIAGVP